MLLYKLREKLIEFKLDNKIERILLGKLKINKKWNKLRNSNKCDFNLL